MKIKISGVNEFPFYPDITDGITSNLDLPEKDRFTIVLKKINNAIDETRWAHLDENKEVVIDQKKKFMSQIARIENPITLEKTVVKEDGSKEIKEEPLTAEDLFSDVNVELFGISHQLLIEIGKLNDIGSDVKKS